MPLLVSLYCINRIVRGGFNLLAIQHLGIHFPLLIILLISICTTFASTRRASLSAVNVISFFFLIQFRNPLADEPLKS